MNKISTIIIANGIMDSGGTETLIMEILRHQTGRLRYILLVHYQGEIKKGVFDDEIQAMGVSIIYIPSVGSLGISRYCRKFQEVVAPLGKIDAIHCHLNANGGVICKAAKMAGIENRICHCHADIRFKGSKFHNLKEEISLQILRAYANHYGNYFWACSHEAWGRLFYPWKSKVIIPNMINVQNFLSTAEQNKEAKSAIGMDGKLVIGSVGRVARIKNYELALETIYSLRRKGIDAHFVCYGRFDFVKDDYCASLLKLSNNLHITENIHFMGNTLNVAHDIKAFDIFLMPSITEGFGMAAIEAQAAGIPTLLSNGVPRIVDMELGLAHFLPLNDAEAWALMVEGLGYKVEGIAHDRIVQAFEKKGYNSVSIVKMIEDKYLEMITDK